MKKNQLENCSFIKTILMIIVIFGHACAYWSGKWFINTPIFESKGISSLYQWVNSFHIYSFTLVSGYIFAFKISNGSYNNYLSFLKIKIKRLIIPYFFCMFFWVLPISEYFYKWNYIDIFKKYILCIDPSQLWFLWMLFGVFAIVWPLRNLFIYKPITGYILSVLFYSIAIVCNYFIPNIFCIWSSCQYVIFFFIGFRLRIKEESNSKIIIENISIYTWLIIDLLLFGLNLFVGYYEGIAFTFIKLVLGLFLHVSGSIMAWRGLQILASSIHWKENKIFAQLSSYSMPMYLFHQQVIYLVLGIFNGVVNPWINVGLNFIISLLVSYVISSVLMKWKITSFLLGEKI